MNTAAMVLTITGLSLFYLPGFFGWLGIAFAATGTTIGIIGLTNIRTSPSGLGMDVAAWIYGLGTTAVGVSFQIRYGAGTLDALLLPVSISAALVICGILLPVFAIVQILVRRKYRKYRKGGIAAAICLFFIIVACGWTALTLAHRTGIILV